MTGLNLAFRSSSVISSIMAAVCKMLRGNPAPTTFRALLWFHPGPQTVRVEDHCYSRELAPNSCFQRASQNLKVGAVTEVWSLWLFNMEFCSNEMRGLGLGFLHPHETNRHETQTKYLWMSHRKAQVKVQRAGLRRGKDTQHSAEVWCIHLTSERSMVWPREEKQMPLGLYQEGHPV